jgi:hypothetical protein
MEDDGDHVGYGRDRFLAMDVCISCFNVYVLPL